MKKLEDYLYGKGRADSTVKRVVSNTQHFIAWCNDKNIDPEKAEVEDLYDYQTYRRDNGSSPNDLRHRISSIKHYYFSIGRRDNPALFIKTDKVEKKIIKGELDEEELLDVYLCAMEKTHTHKRNKVMLGFIVFQALTKMELELLELEHVDFQNKRIYVPGSKRTNSRWIALREFQIPLLETYIFDIRPQQLIECQKDTSRLFFSLGIGSSLHNTLGILMRKLKLDMPYVKDVTHLRDSRIILWMKKYNLREAQVLSGIKYASSMLRFRRQNKDKLKRKIDQVHPMRNF